MDISTVIFLLVVFGFRDVQAGPSGPTLADRVAVMEEEMRAWKIVTVQAKTQRSTLARRMGLAFAEINILKSSLQNAKTQLKEITQELKHVRRERDTYNESLRKLRGEVTGDVRALKLLLNHTVPDLHDVKILKSELNLTNEELLTAKQQITGLAQDLMVLNTSCCQMRKKAEVTDGNERSPTTSSLAQSAFTPATATYPETTADSTTEASEDLTPSETDPPAPVTTQNCDPHATPSPAKGQDLYSASMRGDLQRVKQILGEGHVDINSRRESGRTLVMEAAWRGLSDVVELLVGGGADVSLVDKIGNNVLHWACRGKGDLGTVKLVLSLDVLDINSRGWYSMTPVMEAARYGYRDVVEFLVGRGANVSLVDKFGNNVLHWACRGKGDLETVKLVLSLDVLDINARNNAGETVADQARLLRRMQVKKLLVSRGAH